jgi:hypothetical protein
MQDCWICGPAGFIKGSVFMLTFNCSVSRPIFIQELRMAQATVVEGTKPKCARMLPE